ncbi:MAG: ISAs1 family transposase [Spirochaetaceae bacterium]|jgi:predicted transposase YbfD/YdcC|nr:ISAs1 family transposase [Spirochaetaceae bacterium]
MKLFQGSTRVFLAVIWMEKGADYVLAVKENQPVLYEGVRECFEGLESGEARDLSAEEYTAGEERGHGRVENRGVKTVRDIGWLDRAEKWKDLKTVIEYRCHRTGNGKTAVTKRYYISSADMGAEEFYLSLRGRWSIENNLHWSLDVIFREDAVRAGKNHAMRESEYPAKDSAGASSGRS